jgi:hypothetical protein
VAFGIAGLPGGATASFNPPSLTTNGTSTLTVQTTTNTPGGSYPLTISATNGSTIVTTNITLSVNGVLPPPTIGALVLQDGKLIFSGTGGRSGGTYYLLSSTNLALPPAAWTVLTTNTYDTNGNFNVTNSQPPGTPQTFYLLQLQ